MTPHEIVAHALAALVQGNIAKHIHDIADDVTWKLNENAAQRGKAVYQRLITAMVQDEVILGFQLDGAHLDSRGGVWICVLEDRRIRWRDRLGHPGEHTERVASAYQVADGAITEIRMTALGGAKKKFTYPPSIALP